MKHGRRVWNRKRRVGQRERERESYSQTNLEFRDAVQDVSRHTALKLLCLPFGPLTLSIRSLNFAFDHRSSFANPCVAVDIWLPILYIADRIVDIMAELRDAKL